MTIHGLSVPTVLTGRAPAASVEELSVAMTVKLGLTNPLEADIVARAGRGTKLANGALIFAYPRFRVRFIVRARPPTPTARRIFSLSGEKPAWRSENACAAIRVSAKIPDKSIRSR